MKTLTTHLLLSPCALLIACGSAPTVPAGDVGEASAFACFARTAKNTEHYGRDETVPEDLSEVLAVPPCLDAEGNDAECPERVEVQFIASPDVAGDKDVLVYRGADESLTRYWSVVGEVSGGACGWEVEHARRTIGGWVVASIHGPAFEYGAEGCTPAGIYTVLAFVDAASGTLASVVTCTGDKAADVTLANGVVSVVGCRGDTPSIRDAQLRECLAPTE